MDGGNEMEGYVHGENEMEGYMWMGGMRWKDTCGWGE